MCVFVDSNVLLYAHDRSEAEKQQVAHAWLETLWLDGAGRVSPQVLREFYWNATRKLARPLTRTAARDVVRKFGSWSTSADDAALVAEAWKLEDRSQLAWWDALIVASAIHANCRWLLTEDLQDGQRFGSVLVVDPFRHTPDEVRGEGAGGVAEAAPGERRPRRRATRRVGAGS
jgi:predicted nucleic acid-binding protein